MFHLERISVLKQILVAARSKEWFYGLSLTAIAGSNLAGGGWGNVKDKDHLEDIVVDGRIMLQLVFSKQDGWTWTGLLWLRLGTSGWML